MGALTAIAIGAGLAAVGTGVQTYAGIKAGKAQRRQQRAKVRRSNQQEIARRNIERGRIQAAGIASGAGLGSSSVMGGLDNTSGNAASNVAFLKEIQAHQDKINSAAMLGQVGQAATSLGGSIMSTTVSVEQMKAMKGN